MRRKINVFLKEKFCEKFIWELLLNILIVRSNDVVKKEKMF